ncbi:hypothetical protein DA091_24425 [Vibrio alginolyticus]|nr:hypothetical protein DA091_24425 [Vibrio alginolyticus]
MFLNKSTNSTPYVFCQLYRLDYKFEPELALAHNAALSGEQRKPPNLNHCAVNTKFKANRKCQALGIRLKRFVMCVH